ncbi:hypothetical protein [Moorena producens]|uniref:hypothetical protein n=1 Tax=Moorena producens TaxID=1155739 RepID=UPI0013C56B65|nr:hypothetical protein [Moorena sp. SIO3G5]
MKSAKAFVVNFCLLPLANAIARSAISIVRNAMCPISLTQKLETRRNFISRLS